MNDLTFQNRLQAYGSRLSKGEQRILEFILNNEDFIKTCPSTALAKKAQTSNSTVTRFCQHLGYGGYIEFQTLFNTEHRPPAAPCATLDKLRNYYQVVLQSASQLVPEQQLDAFIEKIKAARQILLLGLGGSGLTAQEFNMRLVQMGFMSTAVTDNFLMIVQTSQFSSKDLIIAVSNSGETREIVSACRLARQVGVPVCSMTQMNRSSLAKLSDTVLLSCDVQQVQDPCFINSQFPLLFLIDTITYTLMEHPVYQERRAKALEAMENR